MKFAQRLLLLAGALFACQFSVGVAKAAAATVENEPASTTDATAADHGVPAKNAICLLYTSDAADE